MLKDKPKEEKKKVKKIILWEVNSFPAFEKPRDLQERRSSSGMRCQENYQDAAVVQVSNVIASVFQSFLEVRSLGKSSLEGIKR